MSIAFNSSSFDSFKLALWFDVDETLVDVATSKNSPSDFLKEAQKDISSISEGILKNPILYKKDNVEARAFEVRAFSQQKFNEIFDEIHEVNKFFGQKIIEVNILTNASYTEKELTSVLKTFYKNINVSHFANNPRKIEPKGEYMEHHRLASRSPISKDRTYIIDDGEDNCNNAEKHGFKAIRMNTSNYSLPVENHDEAVNASFARLNKIIANTKSLGMQFRMKQQMQMATIENEACTIF